MLVSCVFKNKEQRKKEVKRHLQKKKDINFRLQNNQRWQKGRNLFKENHFLPSRNFSFFFTFRLCAGSKGCGILLLLFSFQNPFTLQWRWCFRFGMRHDDIQHSTHTLRVLFWKILWLLLVQCGYLHKT